ncbi:MAG: RNA-directed DNA polymerase [Clostridiales bacterium]|nr:RNA-directed DNA polymerase [Clostridiales bacterium]
MPYYPDRIIHWAIMLQIQQIFMKTFIYDTYAAIPNKGSHLCLKRMKKEILNNKKECKYCLKVDIKKFFPNIDQDILSKMMRKKIKDKDLLWLLDDIIYSTKKGLPIGNYTSQFFGNFYLTYFDHWCKENLKLKRYYRYMDDIVIFHDSKDFLHEIKSTIDNYLRKNLKVRLKNNWQIFPTFVRGVDFIGYKIYGEYVLLRKSTLKRMKLKISGFLKFAKKTGYITEKMWNSYNSYKGIIKWCNSYSLYKKYFKPLEKYSDKFYKEMIKNENKKS